MTTSIFVSGASGFVGSALVTRLRRDSTPVVAAVRHSGAPTPEGVERAVGDILSTDFTDVLRRCDRVVHCAARVHVMQERARDPQSAFDDVNLEGTRSLALQASRSGVRRFVFVSTAKVLGESTERGRPFTADSPRQPIDAYGRSKAAAEAMLERLARDTGMEVTIVRPPLVYGPGVRANFALLLGWIQRGVPLPFGSITENRRSLVALGNLVDLLVLAANHPRAAGLRLHATDGEDLSTRDLIVRAAHALRVRARLVRVPTRILSVAARWSGRPEFWQRIGGSLQLDDSVAREALSWRPPLTVDEGMLETVAAMARRSDA